MGINKDGTKNEKKRIGIKKSARTFFIRNLKLGVALQFLKIYPLLGLKDSYEFLILEKIGRKLLKMSQSRP